VKTFDIASRKLDHLHLDTYVQMGVEKSNVKNLFAKTCAGLYVPIANLGGWADLNVRAGFMHFKEREAQGKQCVLLVFTDHDPGGLHINKFLRSNLEELARAVQWSPDNLIIERFGLDYDFIEREQLTWINNLATSKGEYPLDDKRHLDHFKDYVQSYLRKFGARKVEADALLKSAGAWARTLPSSHFEIRPHDRTSPLSRETQTRPAAELDRLLKET